MGSSQPSADDEVTEAVDLGRSARDELQPGASVGRYVVVARVGAGGMGVVYLARDPDLDRNVALKLLAPTHERGRALREAQALAKLSHPNVVTVFDVGVLGERVWLAMEFVEGTTLAQWLRERERGWPEILAALLAAGDGLAAAHDVKLVHRDVKPDNIMVTKGDGDAVRVLVTDFGLAREIVEDPAATPVRGTPAYMAPERHRAGSVDAKVDQFGWCVTAWEAFFGERPFEGAHPGALLLAVTRREIRAPQRPDAAPRWLRRALERGLDPDPAKRWPSLGELLLHLRRASTRRRRRLIVGLGVLGVAAIVALPVARYVQRVRAHAACIADADTIAEIWNDDVRARIDTSVHAVAAPYAAETAERLPLRIDAWVYEWRATAHAECDATARDPALHEAAQACLAEGRDDLAAELERLALADALIVRRAIPTIAGLTRARACADDAALARRPRPSPADAERVAAVRRRLARAHAEQSAIRHDEARATVDDAIADAQAIGWPPLVAEALRQRGVVAEEAGDAHTAELALAEAYAIATAADDDDDALAAANLLSTVVGVSLARPADGMTWAQHADAVLARQAAPDPLRAARLELARARLHEELGDNDTAIVEIERAVDLRRDALGEAHPSVAAALNNLGWAHYRSGRTDVAAELFAAAFAINEGAFGPDHPDCALPLLNLGNVAWQRNDIDAAAGYYERAYEIMRAALGEEHADVATPLMNLGAIDFARGRYADAVVRFERAAVIKTRTRGADHPDTLGIQGNLATALHLSGEAARAERILDDVVDRMVAVRGADHIDVARVLVQRGRVRVDRWERSALDDLEPALVSIERAVGRDHRELTEVSALLGLAWARWGDAAQAEARCREAIAIDERTGGSAASAEAWIGLALVHAARGERKQAIDAADRVLAIAAEHGVPAFMLAEARLVLARMAWPSDRARVEAERARDDALADPLRDAALAWLADHR